MQLNSKKHKHWRLPLHISFAKHMNAFAETQSKAQAYLESVSRGICCLSFPNQNFLEWSFTALLGWPLNVGLRLASLGPGLSLLFRPMGSLVFCRHQEFCCSTSKCQGIRFCPTLQWRVIWLIDPQTLTISLNGLVQLSGKQNWHLLAGAKPLESHRIGCKPHLFPFWPGVLEGGFHLSRTPLLLTEGERILQKSCGQELVRNHMGKNTGTVISPLITVLCPPLCPWEVGFSLEKGKGQIIYRIECALRLSRGRFFWKTLFVTPSDSHLGIQSNWVSLLFNWAASLKVVIKTDLLEGKMTFIWTRGIFLFILFGE